MATRSGERLAATLEAVDDLGAPGEPRTTSEVAEAIGVTRRAAYDRLETLAERGDLETKKVGAKGRVWWRPPGPREDEAAFAESLLEAQPDLVYAYDAEGRLRRWNDRAVEITGYTSSELHGMAPTDLLPDDETERVMAIFERLLETGEQVTVEVPLVTADGEHIPYEFSAAPITDEDGTVTGVTGVGRDVSERVARERQVRRERDVSDQFIEATPASIVVFGADGTVERVNERAAERLGIDPDDVEGERVGPGELDVYDADGEPIPPGDRAALRAFETGEPVRDFHCQIDLPVGGRQWLSIDAIPLGGGPTPERVLVAAHDITELKRRAQRLARERADQRERLAALHNLNAVVRDINEAVLKQSSRADVERLVCERLAETDSYAYAWIGEGDAADGDVAVRAHADPAEYVEAVQISTRASEATGRGPAGRALRTGELQTVTDVHADPAFEPWREAAERHGFSAVAAIPLEHEGTTYGVLCVYADREGAFAEEERAVVAHLGEVVGHAIAAIERKRALLSDQVVELELSIPDPFPGLDDLDLAGPITVEQTVAVGDGTLLVYGTTDADGFETLESLGATLDSVLEVRELFVTDDGIRYAVRVGAPPLVSAVVGYGGSIEGGTLDEDAFTLVVHLPTDVDVRDFVDRLADVAPEVAVVARRQVARDDSAAAVAGSLADRLTDRQRAALEAGYHAGYFDWPRETDGAEVADSLSISSPTYHQHLRSAQKKLLDALFG